MNRIWTRRPQPAAPKRERIVQSLRAQMTWAAGTEAFQHRDPFYHITESFQQTFDAMGQRHAEQLAGESREGAKTERGGAPPQPDPASARSFYERSAPDDQDMILRFSETAFQRGTLSGAVLRGTGQMMLFSCLKKTVGQSQPDKWQQRKLFEKSAVRRNTSGHAPDSVQFNRGFTDSAVGLVVDTLRDARRTVEDLRDLALGKSEMGTGAGASTLLTMYPFLDDSRERELLEQYRSQLRETAGTQIPISRGGKGAVLERFQRFCRRDCGRLTQPPCKSGVGAARDKRTFCILHVKRVVHAASLEAAGDDSVY